MAGANYKPLTDEQLQNWHDYLYADNPISELLEVVEQARRANRLADAAQARLDVWTRDSYIELKEALAAYRGETVQERERSENPEVRK